SLVVDWQYRKHGKALLVPLVARETGVKEEDAPVSRGSAWRRLGNITETALHDFADIMAFLILGALIAAVCRVLRPRLGIEPVLRESPVLAIPVMMAFAVIFCLCSEADAFVAANFQPLGLWPASSQIAFLVLGPMLDFKLLLMYTRVF